MKARAVAVAAVVTSAQVFTVSDPRIRESSGLVESPTHPGVYWTHNDSGDSSRTFAVDSRGRTIGVWRWKVAAARDWEAITAQRVGGRGVLWVGDIGDNGGNRRAGVLVHRAEEPRDPSGGGMLTATSYRLRYPDGPHDAEALFVGSDGRLRVVSKGLLGGTVYAAPAHLSSSTTNLLTAEHEAPPIVTDGAELPDGDYILRTYSAAYVYASSGTLLGSFALPEQQQGESIAVVEGGRAVLIGSEGRGSPVLRVPLPRLTPGRAVQSPRATAAPAASPSAALPAAADDQLDATMRTRTRVALGAGGLLMLVAAAAAVRSRLRR